MRQVKKMVQRGLYNPDKDNPFDLFLASTNVRWTYYKETESILGRTFGMCVLQARAHTHYVCLTARGRRARVVAAGLVCRCNVSIFALCGLWVCV